MINIPINCQRVLTFVPGKFVENNVNHVVGTDIYLFVYLPA